MRAFFVYARVREARKKTGLGNFEFFGIQKGWRSLHIYIKMKYILKNVYYSLYIHSSIYKYITLKEVSKVKNRIYVLTYINGKLASNEDLKSLFIHERKYHELARKEISYPHSNVKVVKYSTRW